MTSEDPLAPDAATLEADRKWMQFALAQAQEAADAGDVPVGAVVVLHDEIIGRGYNLREQNGDPLAHAEIVALRDAARTLGSWRLDEATLYVTLEPCPMCAGALLQSRIARLVYGTEEPKSGAVRSLFQLCEDPRLPHRIQVQPGVEAPAAAALLRDFFADKRKTPRYPKD